MCCGRPTGSSWTLQQLILLRNTKEEEVICEISWCRDWLEEKPAASQPCIAQGCLFLYDINIVKLLSESVLMLLTQGIEDGQQCMEVDSVSNFTGTHSKTKNPAQIVSCISSVSPKTWKPAFLELPPLQVLAIKPPCPLSWCVKLKQMNYLWSLDPCDEFGHQVFKDLLHCMTVRQLWSYRDNIFLSFSCILCCALCLEYFYERAFFLKMTTVTKKTRHWSIDTSITRIFM